MKIKQAKRIIKDMIGNDTLYDMRASYEPEMYKVEDGMVYGWRRAAPISKDQAIDEFFDWCDQDWLWDDDLYWEQSILEIRPTEAELENEWELFLEKNEHISHDRAEDTYQIWYTLAPECDWTLCDRPLPDRCRPEKVTGIYGAGPCTLGLLS